MIPVLLIVIPLVSGLAAFFLKNDRTVRAWALLGSIGTLAVSILGLTLLNAGKYLEHHAPWLSNFGSSFYVKLDGMGQLLCLLTAIAFPLIFVSTWHSPYKKPNNFFGLMLLTQAGLMGVFLAMDALLFYFFWELALIPVYFLCSQWGGERRIPVTFKFFIYTFLGSVIMLVALIYLYSLTPDHSFSIESFYKLRILGKGQDWIFWALLVAFAIKMPIFPFHTWQPDTYEQSPTATTMVLSGVMVKMGLLGVLRWLMPITPFSFYQNGDTVSTLIVIGILYASILAIRQDDVKRLVAYSSMAHIGLMALALFAETQSGTQGVMIQMFNHGINIIGLWIIVELIERQFGTRKLSELGGIAQGAPVMAIMLVIIALANIALPLTNAFVGEFMMFNGIFYSEVTKYNVVFTAVAMVAIILAAVYTLNMIQKIMYGKTNNLTARATDLKGNERLALAIIVILILIAGIYPAPFLELTNGLVDTLIKKTEISTILPGK